MQVKIGPKFFANELRVYRNWLEAFWRENIQNSYDANADSIDITIGEGDSPETKLVVISDNGRGMDRATLENIYFTLGETSKQDGDVGGFGKARILTCFAQKSYTLRTNNLFVTGEGSSYEIEEMETRVKGVRLEIQVFHKGKDIEAPLRQYLKYSHLDGCRVSINGVRFNDWTYKNKFERDLSFGKVYTNKSKEAGILVRVNGVHMFKPYTSAPFLVIVEIDQTRSKEVLQASRDGLLNEFQSELESFVNELNINKQSALRQKRSKSIKYNGTGTSKSRRSSKPTGEQVADHLDQLLLANNFAALDTKVRAKLEAGTFEDAQHFMKLMKETVREQHGVDLTPQIAAITQGPLHSHGHTESEHDELDLTFRMFDTIVVDDTSNPRVRKVIESYYPQNWDLLGKVGFRHDKRYNGEARSFRAGVEKYKLLVVWKAAVEFAIRLMQDELQVGPDEIDWSVGWTFSDTALAKHRYDEGTHWILVNPCKGDGTMRHGLSDKASMAKIVSEACHEVAHIVYSDHDERFANLLNDILEKAFLYKTEMLKHMQNCKEDAMAELERAAVAA